MTKKEVLVKTTTKDQTEKYVNISSGQILTSQEISQDDLDNQPNYTKTTAVSFSGPTTEYINDMKSTSNDVSDHIIGKSLEEVEKHSVKSKDFVGTEKSEKEKAKSFISEIFTKAEETTQEGKIKLSDLTSSLEQEEELRMKATDSIGIIGSDTHLKETSAIAPGQSTDILLKSVEKSILTAEKSGDIGFKTVESDVFKSEGVDDEILTTKQDKIKKRTAMQFSVLTPAVTNILDSKIESLLHEENTKDLQKTFSKDINIQIANVENNTHDSGKGFKKDFKAEMDVEPLNANTKKSDNVNDETCLISENTLSREDIKYETKQINSVLEKSQKICTDGANKLTDFKENVKDTSKNVLPESASTSTISTLVDKMAEEIKVIGPFSLENDARIMAEGEMLSDKEQIQKLTHKKLLNEDFVSKKSTQTKATDKKYSEYPVDLYQQNKNQDTILDSGETKEITDPLVKKDDKIKQEKVGVSQIQFNKTSKSASKKGKGKKSKDKPFLGTILNKVGEVVSESESKSDSSNNSPADEIKGKAEFPTEEHIVVTKKPINHGKSLGNQLKQKTESVEVESKKIVSDVKHSIESIVFDDRKSNIDQLESKRVEEALPTAEGSKNKLLKAKQDGQNITIEDQSPLQEKEICDKASQDETIHIESNTSGKQIMKETHKKHKKEKSKEVESDKLNKVMSTDSFPQIEKGSISNTIVEIQEIKEICNPDESKIDFSHEIKTELSDVCELSGNVESSATLVDDFVENIKENKDIRKFEILRTLDVVTKDLKDQSLSTTQDVLEKTVDLTGESNNKLDEKRKTPNENQNENQLKVESISELLGNANDVTRSKIVQDVKPQDSEPNESVDCSNMEKYMKVKPEKVSEFSENSQTGKIKIPSNSKEFGFETITTGTKDLTQSVETKLNNIEKLLPSQSNIECLVPNQSTESNKSTESNDESNEIKKHSTLVSKTTQDVQGDTLDTSKKLTNQFPSTNQSTECVTDSFINYSTTGAQEMSKSILPGSQYVFEKQEPSLSLKSDYKFEAVERNMSEISKAFASSTTNEIVKDESMSEKSLDLKKETFDLIFSQTNLDTKDTATTIYDKNCEKAKQIKLGTTCAAKQIISEHVLDPLEKTSSSKASEVPKSSDDKLNNILIDMLIEQESIKYPVSEVFTQSEKQLEPETPGLPEKHDIEQSEKSTKQSKLIGFKTVTSYGEIESLLTEADIKMSLDKDHEVGNSSFVTTPTMQRRKIGGSQRLSREERPTLREVTHIIDYSSSDEDETNHYTVTEPTDRKVTFLVESEDENVPKVSDSSSEHEIEVTEMTPSPTPLLKRRSKATIESESKSGDQQLRNKSERSAKKVERRFERMASETLEADPAAKYKTDHEFQRMVSQLSSEEVDACLTQWDEGGLTPSEEMDSTKDTLEGDIEPDVEALPEAFLESTNPFTSTSTQWVEFEREMSNVPSSIFWAFDRTPTSTLIRPNDLDIPVKSGGGQGNPFTVPSQTNPSSLQSLDEPPLYINTLGQSYGSSSRWPCALGDSPLGAPSKLFGGESAGEQTSKSPVPPTTREGEEAFMDLAAGLQDAKGASFSGPSSGK